jgi:hypothetical protein
MMDWLNQVHNNPLAWLLERTDPGVRYLVLRDLCDLPPGDPELDEAQELVHKQGTIVEILTTMEPDGYWVVPGPGYNPKYRSTVWAILLLAQLGAAAGRDGRISRACNYILDHNLTQGGQFTITGAPSGTVDCLQGNLSWALTVLECEDPRLEKAYEWLARSITGQGVAPATDRHAKPRYYAGKCGPLFACGANNQLPCAWGAVKAMQAFAALSPSRRTPTIQQAIHQGAEFLLEPDPASANYPTGWSDRPSRNWWKFGFPLFYVTDILQTAAVLVNLGYGMDPRLENTFRLILEKQDQQGRWALEYNYSGKTYGNFGNKNKPSKWVTWRALSVLKAVDKLNQGST